MTDPCSLGPWLRRFLEEHLVSERNLARNTQLTRRTVRRRVRLVAVRLPESTEYRFYLTNIDPDSLDAQCVAQTGTGHSALQIAEPDRRWRE